MKKYVSLIIAAVILIAIITNLNKRDPFDPSMFVISDVQNNIEKLSSAQFEGRKTGTIGNEKAMDFVTAQLEALGLPVYRQTFKALVPETETESFFSFMDTANSDEWIKLTSHEDFKFSSWGPGGSLHYEGEAIFADNNVYKLDPKWMSGKVVITEATPFIGESLKTIMDAGAVGALYYTSTYMENSDSYIKQKYLELGPKVGTNFGLGFISREAYANFKLLAREKMIKPTTVLPTGTVHGIIDKIRINQNVEFNSVYTDNIYAVLTSTKYVNNILSEDEFMRIIKNEDVIVIEANIDQVGKLNEDTYYPGALNNASGVAVLLEVAKNMSKQIRTDQTIIFAIVNGGEIEQQGVQAFIKLLESREDHVQVIDLFALGSKFDETIYISGTNIKSNIAKSKFLNISEDLGVKTSVLRQLSTTDYLYQTAGISAVSIFNYSNVFNTLEDSLTMVSESNLSNNILLIQSYLEALVYPINPWQALKETDRLIVIGILVYLLTMYLLEVFRHQNTKLEKLYFSTPVQLIKKAGSLLTPISILLLLIFITKLPRDLDIAVVGGNVDTNFSLYLTLKNAIDFINNLFENGINNFDFIVNSFKNSTILFTMASILAIVLGIIKGMFDAYSDKENSDIRSFVSLTALSVPDIMWILLSNILIIKIGSYFELPILRHLVFPLITLSIMPTIYISRISYLAFIKEKTQPYFYALKSRGYSKMRIYRKHLLIPVLENVLTSMLGLASVMISNMIIVEYLFDYKGLANFVLLADKSKDEVTFISLIAAISVLYIAFTSIIRLCISLTTSRQKGGGNRV